MNYGKAFSFMTEDETWITKLLIGGGLVFIGAILAPILIGFVPLLIVAGYMVELLQNVMRGNLMPLPEWTDVGAKLLKGVNVLVIGFVYALPMILVICCYVLLTIAASSGGSGSSGSSRGDNSLATVVSLLSTCISCFSFIYGIILYVVGNSAVMLYAANERLSDAFKFGDVLNFIRSNAQNLIIALLLGYAAQLLAGFGVIACFIGVFFTGVWASMVQYHLLGQVYQASLGASSSSAMTNPSM
jgi:hypothetical protein